MTSKTRKFRSDMYVYKLLEICADVKPDLKVAALQDHNVRRRFNLSIHKIRRNLLLLSKLLELVNDVYKTPYYQLYSVMCVYKKLQPGLRRYNW